MALQSQQKIFLAATKLEMMKVPYHNILTINIHNQDTCIRI